MVFYVFQYFLFHILFHLAFQWQNVVIVEILVTDAGVIKDETGKNMRKII